MNQTIKKFIIGIIIVIVVVIGYSVIKDSSESVSTKPIKIGVTLPLTGNLAFIGEGVKDAMDLAIANLHDKKHEYEIIYEDDQFDAKMAATTANKLIDIDKVDIIVSVGSGTGNVVSPIAQKNKVVHFGMASDPTVAVGKYNFVHWTPPYEESKVLIEELQKRGFKKVGLFEANHPGPLAVSNSLREIVKDTDIELVSSQRFNVGEKDFKTLISNVKNSGAEIYILEALSPELEILTRQLKDAGIEVPLTSVEAFEFTGQIDLFEGEWYVNAADATREFSELFKEVTGKNPTIMAPNGYDIINLVVSVIEKSFQKPSANKFVDLLMNIKDYDGALGLLSVNEDGFIVSKAVVRIIKDGKPVTISQ